MLIPIGFVLLILLAVVGLLDSDRTWIHHTTHR